MRNRTTYYRKNKAQILEKSKKYAEQNIEKVREHKQKYKDKQKNILRQLAADIKKHCCICGMTDKVCLEFHHRNPSEKTYLIAKMISSAYSTETFLTEVSKCDIICANCHRRTHYPEQPNKKTKKHTLINSIKESTPCQVCGEEDYRCLDFHHMNEDKIANIGKMLKDKKYSVEDISREIEKCQVVCVNCHRKIHEFDNPRKEL